MFRNTRIGKDIEGIFEKIDQLLPEDGIAISSALHGLSDVFHFHQPGTPAGEANDSILSDLFRAIIEKRNCWVEYKRGMEPKKAYIIQPYSLLFHAGVIYCVAFHAGHEAWIYLALHRIQSVSLKDETFTRDMEFKLKEFLKNNFGIWRQDPVNVIIRFKAEIASSIQDRIWHQSQKINDSVDLAKESNSSFYPDIFFSIEYSEQFPDYHI